MRDITGTLINRAIILPHRLFLIED